MADTKITDTIKYIGVNDKTINLFESQYSVPNGVSYNSYVIKDEKIVVMDTVDRRATNEWFENLQNELDGKDVDYLVVSHLEPDHASNIKMLAQKYPNMKIVGNSATFKMLPQFFNEDFLNRQVVVTEGESLNIGMHTLQFFMAPMVHWPEVMVTYEQTEKVLFSADGFGKFGTLDTNEEWVDEARRYFINIVGKYGMQVQSLLKKAATLDIKIICPLHGPILKENLGYYIKKYDIWSSYEPEEEGILIAYNSIHGNTAKAVEVLKSILEQRQIKQITIMDLARQEISQAISQAFKYSKMILACPTYDAGLFPYMETFLNGLIHKNYQNRKVAIIENGSWAPMAGKCMKEYLAKMKNITICEPIITIKSTMNNQTIEQMKELAKQM